MTGAVGLRADHASGVSTFYILDVSVPSERLTHVPRHSRVSLVLLGVLTCAALLLPSVIAAAEPVPPIAAAHARDRVLARRLHAQRGVAGFLPRQLAKTLPGGETEEVDIIYKLFNEIAPKYLERVKAGKGGGYTRIIKKINRRGDNAPVSIIELI